MSHPESSLKNWKPQVISSAAELDALYDELLENVWGGKGLGRPRPISYPVAVIAWGGQGREGYAELRAHFIYPWVARALIAAEEKLKQQ